MGAGNSDSSLDKILHSRSITHPETLTSVVCKLENPLIDSHHDLIVSSWSLPWTPSKSHSQSLAKAPRIQNSRNKISWTDSGVEAYRDLVGPHLLRLQDQWLSSPTKSSMSILLYSTNHLMSTSELLTIKSTDLSKSFTPKSYPLSRIRNHQC